MIIYEAPLGFKEDFYGTCLIFLEDFFSISLGSP